MNSYAPTAIESGPVTVESPSSPLSGLPDFQPWPKIPRLRNEIVTITEKINGSCACIYVTETGEVFAASRNRWITPGKNTDNYGFAQWVQDHKDDCLRLGPGRHFGEWYGLGIGPAAYGLSEKRLALFNVFRPRGAIPALFEQVTVLYQGNAIGLTDKVNAIMADLITNGSKHCPCFMRPEGIVIYSSLNKTRYKVLCENDDVHKSTSTYVAQGET